MRLFAAAVVLGALGCCLGPTTEPPPPAQVSTPSPLSQALQGMENAGASGVPSTAAIPTQPPAAPPATPAGAPPPPAVPAATPDSPACADARAAKKAVNDDLVALRMTVGAETAQRLESAGQAMQQCTTDMGCMRDAKVRTAKIEAYDRAKAAHDAELARLATAELGLYEADRAIRAACGQ